MHKRISTSMAVVLLLALLGSIFGAPRPAAAAGQWYAEYYPNTTLSRKSEPTRYESDLTHDWGTGGPGSGVPNDGFLRGTPGHLVRRCDLPLPTALTMACGCG